MAVKLRDDTIGGRTKIQRSSSNFQELAKKASLYADYAAQVQYSISTKSLLSALDQYISAVRGIQSECRKSSPNTGALSSYASTITSLQRKYPINMSESGIDSHDTRGSSPQRPIDKFLSCIHGEGRVLINLIVDNSYARHSDSSPGFEHAVKLRDDIGGSGFGAYKSQVSDLLIALRKNKGLGDRVETRDAYRSLVNQASILADALNGGDRSAILNSAKALTQKAGALRGGPLASVANKATAIGNSILNNSVSMKHFDPIDLKSCLMHVLMDDDFMDSLIDEYRL